MGMTDQSVVERVTRGLSIERLESFLAIAEAGGIAKAAPGNPSRQSQLSRQLREVQAALRVRLVAPAGRGVALTAEGVRLRAVLRDLLAGLAAVSQAGAVQPQEVTLAAGDSVLRWLVLPRLAAALAPDAGVRLTLRAVSDGGAAVRDGDCELAIARGGPRVDGLHARRLGTMRFALFVPRAVSRRVLSPAALATLPFVAVTADPEPLRRFEASLRRPVEVALRCETFPQAAQAVASGHYAAVLPALAQMDIPAAAASPIEVPGLGALRVPLALVARARTLEAAPALARLFPLLGRCLGAGLVG